MLWLVIDGKEMSFNSGYDMWMWTMLNKPKWLTSEKLSDSHEVADVLRNTKSRR